MRTLLRRARSARSTSPVPRPGIARSLNFMPAHSLLVPGPKALGLQTHVATLHNKCILELFEGPCHSAEASRPTAGVEDGRHCMIL